MNFSIKDLIVPTERPEYGLRGLASKSALGGATAASTVAFNDLLSKFTPTNTDARRGARTENPDQTNRDPRTDRTAPEKDRASDHRDFGINAYEDAQPRSDKVAQAPRQENNSTAVEDTHARNTKDEATLPTAADVKSTAIESLGVTVQTPGQQKNTALIGEIVTEAVAGTKAENDTAPVQNQGTAQAVQAALATALPEAAKAEIRPIQFADLATKTDALPEALLAPTSTATTKNNVLATAQSGAQSSAAQVAALKDEPASNSTTKTAVNGSLFSLGGNDEVPLAPLRTPQVPGVLVAQELSGQATGQSTGTTGENTQQAGTSASTGTPASQVAVQIPGTGTSATAVAPQAVLGLAAANIDVESTLGTVRPSIINGVHPLATSALGQATTAGATQLAAAPQSAARAQSTIPVPLDDVAVHIARAAASGADHINIKLKPASLGHIEVKLELTHDGRVTAVVSADRTDTLDMLARDAKGLERALADAGLKADQGSLQFNLRGETNHGGASGGDLQSSDVPRHASKEASPANSTDIPAGAITGYTNSRAASGGVDIRV